MFTGIIQALGRIRKVTPKGNGISAWIEVGPLITNLKIGDSISVSGVCSTVIEKNKIEILVDYLEETLKKTTLKNCQVNNTVNLEICVTPNTPLGGHVVTGHIDCPGILGKCELNDPWGIIMVRIPAEFAKLVVRKGSIAIDGISLTIADIQDLGDEGTDVTCHIIPHTWTNTILHTKQKGDSVNIEFDILGKYILRSQELA